MSSKCNIRINKKLELGVRSVGKSVIINRENGKELLDLNRNVLWIEEVPMNSKSSDIIKLMMFSSISNNKVYFIEEVLIDIKKERPLNVIMSLCKNMPNRLDGSVYSYIDLDDNLCLINLKTNGLSRLESNIREKLKKYGIDINYFKLNSIENSNTDYELIIELKDMEIIHAVIRVDNEGNYGFKINNTIYSEYYNGLEFNVSKNNKTNEFIDINIFIDGLVKYILSSISYIKENQKEIFNNTSNVQTDITVRMMCKSLKNNKNTYIA